MITSALLFTACTQLNDFDFSEYIDVTYNAMGGTMDYQTTRTLKVLPGSLIPDPKGGASGYGTNLQEAKRTGYELEGWYTTIVSENYVEDSVGIFVDYYEFTMSATGNFIKIDRYLESLNGLYVAKISNIDGIVYEPYSEENKSSYVSDEYLFSGAILIRYNYYPYYVEYDNANPEHENVQRYSRSQAYVLYEEENPSHAGLRRFEAKFEFAGKWDFPSTKTTNKNITLYARWIKRYKVIFDQQNGSTSEWSFTNGVNQSTVLPGELIMEYPVVPTKNDQTFLYWALDKEGTLPWDFQKDVFPEDENIVELRLYAYYMEGSFIRITNANELKQVANRPTANYILMNDIDLEGKVFAYTSSILGFTATPNSAAYSGTFLGNGHVVKNFTLTANNNTSQEYSFGFFNKLNGATIKDLMLDYTIVISDASVGALNLGCIAGSISGNVTISNCHVKMSMTGLATTSGISYGPYFGKIASGAIYKIENSSVDASYMLPSTAKKNNYV